MSDIDSISLGVQSSQIGQSLMSLLTAQDIQPGSSPSYELCKVIYLYHPLGQKMAEAPVNIAQSQEREITVQDAPEEVIHAYNDEWRSLRCTEHIHNVTCLSRIYGIAAATLGCEQVEPGQAIDMEKIWDLDIWVNILDPLNTAGSLVLNQIPTAPDFQKPAALRVMGTTYHRQRYHVVMHEAPIYLAFTTSAFGYVGRSVYQRALYPLKSFVASMIADDMIAKKLGLLIAKQKAPGSVIDNLMQMMAGMKRALLKRGETNNVLSIDVEEEIETLNMQNVDGAGSYARSNILKNAATAADMPAQLLENETMVEGFGEGTEDAKNIARFVDLVRKRMDGTYRWFDNLVQYRAWNPRFYQRIQRQYPKAFGSRSYEDAFSEWRRNFNAEWPSLLIEPESERVKVDQTKAETLIAMLQTILGELDPENKATAIQWAADNIAENKNMFPHELTLDFDALKEHIEAQGDLANQAAEAALENGGPPGGKAGGPKAVGAENKLAKFG